MSLSVKPHDWVGNKLLAALPSEEYARILPCLEHVTFSFGESVYESSERPKYAYFPTTSVVSLVYTMEDGANIEMGMVGNEGLIGIALFTGGETRPNRAIVQHAGGAIRMKAHAFQEEFRRGASFQRLSLRYTQALLTQISQKAVCNGLHHIEQRLACWLLMTHDRVRSEKLQVTQEFVSNLLGVRRQGVSLTTGSLRDKGVIVCNRGFITILDRAGLEATACECYRVIKDEYERLLDFKNLSSTAFSICDVALISICSRYITKLFDIVTELSNQACSLANSLFL
jgi:CRP-like cAMP-binding protein